MGVFHSTRTYLFNPSDLAPVVDDVTWHFQSLGYEVKSQRRIAGDWDISLTKGSLFRNVCGLRTALKIELSPQPGSVLANAGIGIFGQQAIPAAITMFLFWPLIATEIWGLVAQSKLDDAALNLIGQSLERHAVKNAPPVIKIPPEPATTACFCPDCGASLPAIAKFCTGCGHPITA
jgi:hypothetical protein